MKAYTSKTYELNQPSKMNSNNFFSNGFLYIRFLLEQADSIGMDHDRWSDSDRGWSDRYPDRM